MSFNNKNIIMRKVLILMSMMKLVMIIGWMPMVSSNSWPGSYWDIPGDYCESLYPFMECCDGRKDNCGVPILDTTCYCDRFCNR